METRLHAGLAVALLVVLAGCVGPFAAGTPSSGETPGETPSVAGTATATPTASPTPTPAGPVDPWSKVELRGGNFSFDAARVYRRVAEMHGLSLAELPDVTIYVRDRTSVSLTRIYDPSAFEETMGIVPNTGKTAIAGLAASTRIYIYKEVLPSADAREATLAHEFAHVVQDHRSAQRKIRSRVTGRPTQETRVQNAMVEGVASYVEHRYRVTYLGATDDVPSWRRVRSARTPFGAFLVAPYVFGQRYVDHRVDSVSAVTEIYERPPQTTEQIIHKYDPGDEPPRKLDVDGAVRGSGWRVADRRTKGELFVRLLLEQELSLDRSARAAAGWGNDRLVAFADGSGEQAYAWLLRWDSRAEADEFATALRDYLDARGVRDGDVWTVDGTAFRVVRPTDETVVLLVGPEAFVTDATVTGDDGRFTVDPDGD